MNNSTFSLRMRHLMLTSLIVFGFGLLSSYAQSTGERSMFIRVENISPDDYFKIAEQYKNNQQVYIKQACVPAEVIMFGIAPSNQSSLDDNFNQVKGVVLENTNLTQVAIIAEYTEEAFLERCKLFRTGISVEQ